MSEVLELPLLGANPDAPFPATSEALEHPNGLLAFGGDLRPERLLNAYRRGIFPWYSAGQPILWWSPAPRCVIYPQDVYLSRRTRRRYNSGVYQLSLNRAFREVVLACAAPRGDDEGTWITPEMVEAYCALHRAGHAHSLEVWQEKDLVGGIYGIAIGAVFFGESMFSQRSDASKIALIALCRLMEQHGYGLLDGQLANPHLERMGATLLPRDEFESLLEELVNQPPPAVQWQNPFNFERKW